MSNVLIRGGQVIDGLGGPRRRADVRIRDGVITEVAPKLAHDRDRVIDAAGATVAPGFVDVHTHFDPSLWWDPSADPMTLHGVTTVVQGNCSLSIAPVRASDLEGLIDAFCFIEDMPNAAFRDGIPWRWEGWRDYREAFDALGCAVNVGALVGHSTVRSYVMGADAWSRSANADECARIGAVLEECLRAGGLGVSTSFIDTDRSGNKVPSRFADETEFVELAQALGRAGRSIFQFVPSIDPDQKMRDIDMIERACLGTGVRGSWTQLAAGGNSVTHLPRLLAQAERTQRAGAGIYPQVSPRSFDAQINFERTPVFISMPVWNDWMQQTKAEKLRRLQDDGWRDAARRDWDRPVYSLFPKGRMHKLRISSASHPIVAPYVGGFFPQWQHDRGHMHEADAFADLLSLNELDCAVTIVGLANDDPDGVAELLLDPRTVVGASDAGAHLTMLCGAGDTTLLLTRHVRERQDFTLERAIQLLAARPAEVFGLSDRGVIAPGKAGDVVIFDIDELRYPEDHLVNDLPDGSGRLTRIGGGYRCTIVSGEVVQLDGTDTGARPGRMVAR